MEKQIAFTEVEMRSPRDILEYFINTANMMNTEASQVSFVEHYRVVADVVAGFAKSRKQVRKDAKAAISCPDRQAQEDQQGAEEDEHRDDDEEDEDVPSLVRSR